MPPWILANRTGFYEVRSDDIVEDLSPGQPLLIDSSITLRKHFEIPTTVDRDPKTLKLELFSRFLPADVDQYICRFIEGGLTENNSRRVLGLAIKEKDMDWIEGIHGENEPRYFLEHVLRPSPQKGSCLLELDLPNGTFFGVYLTDFLTWARFLEEPDKDELNSTRDYIRSEYPDCDEIHQSPEFATSGNSKKWPKFIGNWLPDSFETSLQVKRSHSVNYWRQWQLSAWVLLLFALLTVTTWWSYNYFTIQRHEEWIQTKSQEFLGTTESPNQALKEQIDNLRSRLRSSKEILDVYPRIARIDELVNNEDIHLLQLKIQANQGQIVFMTKSLKAAEELKGNLLDIDMIDRTEIVSTTPREGKEFPFKVNMNLLWTSDQSGGTG